MPFKTLLMRIIIIISVSCCIICHAMPRHKATHTLSLAFPFCLTCLFVLLLSSTQVFSSKASCFFVYPLIFSDSLSFYSFLTHISHVSVCITIIFYTSLFFNAFLCCNLLITALFLSLHCFYILISTNLLLR